MRKGRSLAIGLGLAVLVYLSFIFLGGLFAGGCAADRIESALGRALAADVAVGDASLFIATGRLSAGDVTIRRDGVEIAIDRIDISMRRGGLMLISDRLDEVVVSKVAAELSARGAVALARRDRKPVHIGKLVINEATIAVSPTLIVPGLGRIEATIDRATAREVNLASAISWIAELDEMVAHADIPGGAGAGIDYRDGTLGLSGSWFGSDALSLPFEIPAMSSDLLEVDQLKVLGTAVIKAVAKHVATDRLLDAAKTFLE